MKRKIFEKVDCGEYYDYYFNNKDFIIEVSQDKLVPNRYLTLKNGQKIQSVYLWIVPKHHKDYCTVTDIKTRQTYLIGRSLSNEVLYISRKLALDYLVEQQEKNKDVVVASE